MSSVRSPERERFGQVSVYVHHGAYYVYYRDGAKVFRERVGTQSEARCRASLINAWLAAKEALLPIAQSIRHVIDRREGDVVVSTLGAIAAAVPTISVADLRRRFGEHHEKVLASALTTVSRYAAATAHLETYAASAGIVDARKIDALAFVTYLRELEVAPNGHSNCKRRRLRDRGIRYILEINRSMYHFGIAHGALPKDMTNPFVALGLGRFKVRDSKPIFVFSAQQELDFFRAADSWSLAIHFTLAKTGLRPGELSHLLIEDLDLLGAWAHVRSKVELGWSIKTGRERVVPLVPELVSLFRHVMGDRKSGPVFLRERHTPGESGVAKGNRAALAALAAERIVRKRQEGGKLNRRDEGKVLRSVWRDAGAVPEDRIRTSFIRIASKAGLVSTCPKSWRHTFATLLQEANVDLLIRQVTMGHKPSSPETSPLGMTSIYTHTTPELQSREIIRAVRLRPLSLEFLVSALEIMERNHESSFRCPPNSCCSFKPLVNEVSKDFSDMEVKANAY